MTDSNTQQVLEEMALYGEEAETAPSVDDIQCAVFSEMTGIWTRLGHRNRVYDDQITNRGTEKLDWYVRSLETAAIKANKELSRAEYRANPFEGAQPIGTELDELARDEALDNKHVAVSYFNECDTAFTASLSFYTDITGSDWARPAAFNNESTKVIVTAEQHAAMTGIPEATTEARAKYK